MNIVVTLLVAALIDCLNPATIITQLLLLIKTKSLRTSGIFITTTYVVYLAGGLLLYYGIASHLEAWLAGIEIQPQWILVTESCLLLLCLFFLFRKKAANGQRRIAGRAKLNDWAAVALGLGSTVSDIPTAVPYFAFIGFMEKTALSTGLTIICFMIYVLIYILPMAVMHTVYVHNRQWIITRAVSLESWINRAGAWIGKMLLVFLIAFLVVDIVRYALGASSLLIGAFG